MQIRQGAGARVPCFKDRHGRTRREQTLTKLWGRRAERAVIEDLLDSARSGRSRSLVVRGEAGIGKSALLGYARESASSSQFRVEKCTGVESETPFAFAGLHQLCEPMLDRVGALPAPQEAALEVALGLREGAAPDHFLVGLATLNLLTEVAEGTPLLCLVDDAQWLDQASAGVLAFVVRRLKAERIAVVFALRDVAVGQVLAFTDLEPELRLAGLVDSDARILLDERVHAPLDDAVRDRILAEARGNPLALLELPQNIRSAEWAGGFESPGVAGVPRRVEETFRRRSAGLTADAQTLLLVAAADPTGDARLLWRALDILGTGHAAGEEAEASGLLEIGARVSFRHPLVRSAVYRAAAPAKRRRIHAALAAATDERVDPDRHAWHRAEAVADVDEGAAAELELSAARTLARGGAAAAAGFLQRAAEISPRPVARARRALEAAHAKHDAGAFDAALTLAAIAEMGPLDDLQRARLELLRARLAFHRTEGSDAPGMLLDAARTLAPLDASLARETYLHALDAAMIIGGSGEKRGVKEVAAAALAAPPAPDRPSPADELLDGLVVAFTDGYAAGVPVVRRAVEAFRDRGFDGEAIGQMGSRRWMWSAARAAAAVFDDEIVRMLAERSVRLAREAGALTTLPGALAALSATLALCGDLRQAGELAEEGAAISHATGAVAQPYARLIVAAWRGQEAETTRLYAECGQRARTRNGGTLTATANYALAVLHNGRGSYPAAVEAAVRATGTHEFSNSGISFPELVEAAVRADERKLAESALEEFCARAEASGTPWALGLAARSRALVATDDSAEAHYRESIEQLSASGVKGDLFRSHLVFGEWLRRSGRRQDAREQLRIAHDSLTEMGAGAFAARAARELLATGENPRRGSDRPTDALTAHELQIARMVATGATSREVGTELFLSKRTIDAHLRSIFRKLSITSRRQLKSLLPP